MANRTLRVALLGQGFMGRIHSNAYRQVKRFFDVPFDLDCRVICGRDEARLRKTASDWGWTETATDWRAAVERPDIDVVDICVPNALHAGIAIAAARAGKIVLCEKPLAVSLEEALRMAEAVRGLPNFVWFNYRRVPAVSFCRRLIEEGRVGRVFHYRAAYLQEWGNDPARPPGWKTRRAEAGSGVLGDLMSHSIDIALWLNGPIAEVSALEHTFAANRDVDDATLVLARFANGSVGSFEATRYAVGCRNQNRFEIHGEKGMLRFNLESMNHLEFLDATDAPNVRGPRNLLVTGPDHPYWNNFWKPGHAIGYEHTFIAALGDFLSSLAEGATCHPDFADALAVQKVLGAVDRAAQLRQWVAVE